jgi:hypothetical protein
MSSNFTKNAWNIINLYFNKIDEISNKINVSNSFDYYNMIFSNYLSTIDRKLLSVNNALTGFYILGRDQKFNITNIYSYITLRQSYKYLTDLIKLHIFETEDTKYINSGGSEDMGIHNFKMKYQPAKQNFMFWATNYNL